MPDFAVSRHSWPSSDGSFEDIIPEYTPSGAISSYGVSVDRFVLAVDAAVPADGDWADLICVCGCEEVHCVHAGQLANRLDHFLSVLGVGVQNHDVILLFLWGMVLITLNPMEVKINLRYEEENLHGKSREGREK